MVFCITDASMVKVLQKLKYLKHFNERFLAVPVGYGCCSFGTLVYPGMSSFVVAKAYVSFYSWLSVIRWLISYR